MDGAVGADDEDDDEDDDSELGKLDNLRQEVIALESRISQQVSQYIANTAVTRL